MPCFVMIAEKSENFSAMSAEDEMPFKSKAQQRFFHSPGAAKAGIKPGTVDEFDSASKGMKLPERIGPDKHGNTMMPKKGTGKMMGTTKHGHTVMGY